jgi:Fe-S cluster assembly protein SufD
MENHYADSFSAVRESLPGAGLPWLDDLRAAAMDRYATIGLPTTRQEDWKYTNVRAIAKHSFQPSLAFCTGLMEDDLGDALMGDLEAHRLTFLNGRYSPQLSRPGKLPEGVEIYSISSALQDMPEVLEPLLAKQADGSANGFAALNLAFFTDWSGRSSSFISQRRMAIPRRTTCEISSLRERARRPPSSSTTSVSAARFISITW